MKRTVWLGVAMLVALGVAAWTATCDDVRRSDDASRSDDAGARGPAPATLDGSRADARDPATESAPAALASAPFAEKPVDGGVSVAIVDVDGRPAAAAAAHVVRARRRSLGSARRQRAPLLALEADANGLIRIPNLGRDVDVVARRGSASGRLALGAEVLAAGGVHRLVLQAERTLEVSATDAAGAPVPGIAVDVPRFFPVGDVDVWTDSDGRATWRLRPADETATTAEPWASARFPGQSPTTAKPSWSHGVGRVELRANGADLVLARVVTAPKPGTTLPAEVDVGWILEPTEGGPKAAVDATCHGMRAARGGTAEIGGFRRGDVVRFYALAAGYERTEKIVVVPAHGGVLDVALEPAGPATTVVWKMVDERGTPLAGDVRYRLSQPGAPPSEEALVLRRFLPSSVGGTPPLDAELEDGGVLRLTAAPGFAGVLSLEDDPPGQPRASTGVPRAPFAKVAFPALEAGAVWEAPTLTWPRPPILVAGRVLGPDDAPVVGATVRVVDHMIPGAGPMDLSVRPVEAVARSDANGRFEVRAAAPSPPPAVPTLRATASHAAGRSEPTAFRTGADDLVLRLVPDGAVRGGLRRADLVRRGALFLRLTPTDRLRPVSTTEDGLNVSLGEAEGAFEFRSVPAGTYDFVAQWKSTELATVKGVVVAPGRPTEDPRLRDLVLGADMFEARVIVRDASGAPASGASVRLTPGGARTAHGPVVVRTDDAGEAKHLFPEAPEFVAVCVGAAGFLETTVEKASFPLEVTLSPGAAARVVFDAPEGALRLPGVEAWRLTADPVAAHRAAPPPPPPLAPPTASMGPHETSAVLRGLAVGAYRVRLAPIVAGAATEPGRGFDVGTFDVGAASGEVEVTLTLNPRTVETLKRLATPR
ncbi:MAG TPA: Ig-like domain-containing protein [Planctomycetota bacterium]|nr:Ig-like domain-containing protein [Planctomycetota bacterium]